VNRLAAEAAYAAILFLWVMLVVALLSRKLYEWIRARGKPHNVAVYYARKFIHAAAGGLVALLVPYLFSTPLLPFALAMVLAVLTYIPHRTGKLMEWFQVPDNIYEVHFCLTWGLSVALCWLIFGDLWHAVAPIAFMAFGDAVTGVVRNALYGRRTKAWVGNLAMALVSGPVGYAVAGAWGALAGLAASVVEHFEVGPIDDNVTVPLTALAVLAVGRALAGS